MAIAINYSYVVVHTIKFIYSTGETYRRQAFDPNAPGLASLQWDSADLFQIGVQDHMSYDDAFTIEEVWQLMMT